MDPKRNDNNTKGTQAQADAIARQYRASILAAETIDNAPAKKAENPAQTVRSAASLNRDMNFANQDNRVTGPRSSDDLYREQAYKDNLVQQTGQRETKKKPVQPKTYIYPEEAENFKVKRRRSIKQSVRDNLADRYLPGSFTAAKSVVSRARASTINYSALVWGIPVWLMFQVPFALISLSVIGIIAVFTGFTDGDTGFIGTILSKVASVADWAARFVGIDFQAIFYGLFAIFHLIAFGAGILTLIILYFEYKVSLLNPIMGNGAGLKIGTLILCVIGYMLPITNLFPFAVFWMAAVWLYPK